RLAKAMGMTEFEQAILEFSGLFHDVGKVGIPDHILLKPAKLDPDEQEIMKSHAEKSVEIIKPLTHIPLFRFVLPGVRYHHERYDGKGYPIGLMGEKIPLSARIISVVDTVDAMANTRPYRNALPMDKILQELKDCSGTQFDGNIVDIYLDAVPLWTKETDKEIAREEQIVSRIIKAA
ncbi:MAG: HD domain-containing protein, partial [Bdellovibrionales bacterium]|nr:HD domain-containing protein [Bdellovibrionales bacterium]